MRAAATGVGYLIANQTVIRRNMVGLLFVDGEVAGVGASGGEAWNG